MWKLTTPIARSVENKFFFFEMESPRCFGLFYKDFNQALLETLAMPISKQTHIGVTKLELFCQSMNNLLNSNLNRSQFWIDKL